MAKKIKMNPKVIAFDADDTLWHNEPYFDEAQARFCVLFQDFASSQEILGLILNPVSVGEEAQGSQDVVDCSSRRATRRCIVIFISIFSLLSGVSEIDNA